MLNRFLICLLLCGALHAAPLKVIVSVGPAKTLVEKIAGPYVEITTFVPAGASPHSYEPTPKQLLNAAQADLWFQIGEGFEGKALDALGAKTEIVNLRDGLPLLKGSCCCHDAHDPHIWLTPELLKIQALHIHDVMKKRLPEHKDILARNLQELVEQLNALDLEIRSTVEKAPCKTILVSHPAFGYFCREYGLKQLSIEVDGKEPTPRQMTNLLLEARNQKITRLYLEPQHSAKGGLRLAKELGIAVEWLDPYKADVIENLRTIATTFSKP